MESEGQLIHETIKGSRYFYGTTLDKAVKAINLEAGEVNSQKIEPWAKRFNFFTTFPGVIEIFGPFFTGLQAASHYAFNASLKEDKEPIVLSGKIPQNYKIKQRKILTLSLTNTHSLLRFHYDVLPRPYGRSFLFFWRTTCQRSIHP